jgi:tRNA nucleotidyltransferase (CCA-adding enzyme)
MQRVLERAAKSVTPSPSEEKKLESIAANVMGWIGQSIEREDAGLKPGVTLGGSYARGTWLKGNHDIDFFLLYPPDLPREKLESVAISTASNALRGHPINKRYAEHPYIESFVDGVRINVVPCYAVAPGEWRSAADRSPYHTKYIISRLDDRLRLEARLFKKFVKISGVYGAEVKVQGFSGYVCEVLTLKFGSFLETLRGLDNVKKGDVISLEQFDADLAASFKSEIVILDPVDTTRNLGSAISSKNVGNLVLESRRFLSRPGLRYFQQTEARGEILSSLKRVNDQLLSRILILHFQIETRSPDILWGELRRSSSSISDKLSRLGFQVLRVSTASDEKKGSTMLFLLAGDRIDGLTVRKGPEYFRGKEVEKYYEKNRSKAILTWMGDQGKLESIVQRDSRLVEAKSALEYILQKSNIDEIGLSASIKDELARGFKIYFANRATKSKKVEEWLAKEILEICTND